MATNIWGEEVLDSKDISDEESVLHSDSVESNALNKNNGTGATDNLDGGYYYKVNGEYLGREGKSSNVFLSDKIIEDIKDETGTIINQKISFVNKKQLLINHDDFTYCAGVILQEGSTDEELLFIAHTTNNEAQYQNKTLKDILASTYSTVPPSKKIPLTDKFDKDATTIAKKAKLQMEKNARKAVIDVLNGGIDVSNGSQRWDGVDFISWGLYHAPTVVSENNKQAKFNQFGTIRISKDLFDTLKDNTGATVSFESRKWENPKNPGSYIFDVPEEVFLNVNNWQNNVFTYSTKVNRLTLEATAVRGKTIYWKIIR